MRLPRDLSERDLAKRPESDYGYRVTRTKGSHMSVARTTDAHRHSETVPVHSEIPGCDHDRHGRPSRHSHKSNVRDQLFG